MPIIKLSNNTRCFYRRVALFDGRKPLNVENAKDNLFILKGILDENDIPFCLMAGTALGAIREKGFISHDEDIDLGILFKYKSQVLELIPQFKKAGFDIVRYDRRYLLSLMRNDDYIDLEFFEDKGDGICGCGGVWILSRFLEETTLVPFLGSEFRVAKDYEGYLELMYGDWKTPAKYFEFKMPLWKRFLYIMKEHLKDLLPDFIYFPLLEKIQSKAANKSLKKIEKFRAKHQE